MHLRYAFLWSSQILTVHAFKLRHVVSHNLQFHSESTNCDFCIILLSTKGQEFTDTKTVDVIELREERPQLENAISKSACFALEVKSLLSAHNPLRSLFCQ